MVPLVYALAVFTAFLRQQNDGVTNRDPATRRRSMPALGAITRGTEHACGLSPAGRAFCWGSNRLGQLGDDGQLASRASDGPVVAVDTRESFVVISAGANHTCALTHAGAAFCWGLNLTGELGQAIVANICDTFFPCSRRPVRVETSVVFDTLSSGFGHTCALSGGRAFCWGRNDRGQLGSSRAADGCDGVACNVSPIRVTGVDAFTQISAGGDHTCGIAAGVAYCWGSNAYGQLGVGDATPSSARPLRVAIAERVAAIEARGISTCATTVSGRRDCWGKKWGSDP
jgi:alpha-tubulin suppressor-like RCC1 family protein